MRTRGRTEGTPFIDENLIEDGGLGVAVNFTGTIHDPNSLVELRDAIQARSRLGLAALKAESEATADTSTPRGAARFAKIHKDVGLLLMYAGRFEEAATEIGSARESAIKAGAPRKAIAEMDAILGLIALRKGEVENCISLHQARPRASSRSFRRPLTGGRTDRARRSGTSTPT